jgi:hypothetical protein
MLAIATTNELISLFPWKPVAGTSFDYNREKSITDVGFVSATHTSITEGGAQFDRVTVPMRLIEHDVDVYNYVTNQTDPNGDQKSIQIAQQLKATGRTLQGKMFTGAFASGFVVTGTLAGPAVTAAVPSAHTDSVVQGPGSLRYTHVGTLWQYRAPGDREYGPAVAVAADATVVLLSDNPSRFVAATIVVASATADETMEITFSTSTEEPDGLNKILANTSQVRSSIGVNGDALSFAILDQMIYDLVKVRDNRVFVMNGSLKRKYMELVRGASGGMTPEQTAIPSFGAGGAFEDQMVPSYQGIPILQVDDIPNTEAKGSATDLSSCYLISLGEEGFHGGVQSTGDVADADLDPYMARLMGIKLYDLGQRETKGADGTRIEWMGAYALGSKLAAARSTEIITA